MAATQILHKENFSRIDEKKKKNQPASNRRKKNAIWTNGNTDYDCTRGNQLRHKPLVVLLPALSSDLCAHIP